MSYNLQFVTILLLYLMATQGTQKAVSDAFTISNGTGTFLDYYHNCNGSFPNSSIFSREGHFKLVTALKNNRIPTAWLPLQRKNLTEWTWLSGETLGPAISNPDTVVAGYDCAFLWKRDGMIIDNPCYHHFRQYICSSSIPCIIQVGKMVLHCLEISGKAFRIYQGNATWFQAKQACHERNSTLASFEKENYEDIINKIKTTEGSDDKTWIGLRLTDYVYRIPGFSDEDVNFYMWQREGPCLCPQKACAVIFNNNNKMQWKVEDCGSSHHFICGVSKSSQPFTQIKKHHGKGHVLHTVVIVISSAATFIFIALMTILACRKFKRYKSRKYRYQEQMPEQSMPLKQTESNDPSTRKKEMEYTLLEEAALFRKKIKEQTHPGKENKNILFVGLIGTGKSSLISSLITALTPGPYQAYAEPGDFGEVGKAVTWCLEAFPLIKPHDKRKIEPINQPVLWDCPGFLDDDSESTVNLLQDIITGKFLLSTRIPNIAGTTKYEKPEENNNTSNTCSKMDLIIFVHDCQNPVPENLAAAVLKATRHSQDFKIPLLLVINKLDTVEKDTERLEGITNQVSKVLGLYNQVDRIFQLSCYFADDKQKEIKRSTKIDGYMCAIWTKLLYRLNYISSEQTLV